MDPGILVPPKGYGGHERLVAMFAKEYVRLGHQVELLVTAGSYVEGCVVHPFGEEGFPPKKWDARISILSAWKFLRKRWRAYDVIHNFGRLAYLLPVLNRPVRKIMTYGRVVSAYNIRLINSLPTRELVFTAPSDWCVNSGNVAGKWKRVFNAVDFSIYTLQENIAVDAPLIFLSRLERLKGAHEAIEIALATNNRLVIAGNISPLVEEQEYFKKEIEPFIDGKKIVYVGALDDEGKNKYLGEAKAMLFPARTEEAFGMVMVEAMACGTPVIAYGHSAVPEVIVSGKTGFVVKNMEEMKERIRDISSVDRTACRILAEGLFDVRVVVQEYMKVMGK